jgi:hypothetical protein
MPTFKKLASVKTKQSFRRVFICQLLLANC